MGFLNPLFLLGLLGAAVPLLIHLWSRRRTRVVEFSTLRFLREVHRHTVRRIQIEQWLILFIRASALAALALGLARPVLHSGPLLADARGRSTVAIVLDTSASMGYQGLNGVPFHRAQETAAGLLRSLRPGDTATLILAAERPRVLFDPPTPQIGDVIQAVLTAEPTPLGTRLLPAVERALAMLQRAETPNRELYVLSDFARHGWESAPLKAEGVRVVLIPLGPPSPANVGVVGLRVREPLIASGLPLTLEVTLRNYGAAPVRDRRLRIQVGEAVRASRSVDLPPNAEVTETFPLTFDVAGLHLLAATLDPDRFPEDDRLIEVVSVLGQVDALIVGSRPQFLRLALDPYRLETPQIAYTIRAGALRPEESRQRELDRPDLLIVQDPDFSDDRLLAALRNRLLQGGPVILFLGERSARTRPPEWMGIAFLEERAFDPPLGIRPVHLSADGSLLPPWPESALDGAAARALWGIFQADFWARPTAPHVRRAVVPFPSPDSSLRVLALLENGAPLVVAGDLQEGRFFLVGLPAEGEDWSDLPVHPAFVPMMQQLALLAVSPVRQPTRTLRTGAPYRLPAAPEDPQSAEVVRPDGTTATVGRTEDGSAFVYTDTTALGVYQVRLGERNELFAVRLPPEEGDLRPLEPQEVTAAFGGSALWWGDASERGREPNQELRRNGVELWGFFVLLGIGLLVVDSLLSNRRLPETAES